MAIPAQDLTIHLTESEATLMFDLAEVEMPGSTGADKRAWAETVGKQGLRTELGRIQYEQTRQAENTNRESEKAAFDAAFPPVPEFVPEPEVPEQTWTRQQLLAWLADRGTTGVAALDDAELWTLVQDLLD